MSEPDTFERSLETALRDFAQRGVGAVDTVEFVTRVAGSAGPHPLPWTTIGRLAWLLLVVALLAALLASAVFVGARLTDRSDDRAVLVRAFEPRDASVVAVSPDGTLLATAGGGVALLDVDTGDVRKTLRATDPAAFTVYDIAFSPDSALVALVSGRCTTPGPRVQVWDVESGELVLQRLEDFEHLVTSVAFSPDGTTLAVGTGCIFYGPDSAYVKAWDIASGAQLLDIELPVVHDFVGAVAFSPDGALLAVTHGHGAATDWATGNASLSARWAISLLDATTGRLRLELGEASGAARSTLAFSPDGTRLASINGEARVWDVVSGDELPRLEGPASGLQDVAFSPAGHVIACERDHVRSWDTATGALLSEVVVDHMPVGPEPVVTTDCRLAVLRDDVVLVTYAGGYSLRLWRVPVR